MANTATIDRETEQFSEEQEHGRQISDNYRRLLEPSQTDSAPWAENYAYNTPAYNPAVANPSVRMYGVADAGYRQAEPEYRTRSERFAEYREPVVPASPEAPSAAKRLDDYVPIHRGMTGLTRMGDLQNVQSSAAGVAAPAKEGKRMLFEGLSYQNGELVDMNATLAPTIDSSYMPENVMDDMFASMPVEQDDEEDSRPTKETLSILDGYRKAEMLETRQPEQKTGFLSSLSTNAKIALLTVGAVIVVMIALICVNTAVLGSLKENISDRKEQVEVLEQQVNEIQNEIEEITSPEYIEDWAISQGLVKQP